MFTDISRTPRPQEDNSEGLHQGAAEVPVSENTPSSTQTDGDRRPGLTRTACLLNYSDAKGVQGTDVVNITRTTAFPTVSK